MIFVIQVIKFTVSVPSKKYIQTSYEEDESLMFKADIYLDTIKEKNTYILNSFIKMFLSVNPEKVTYLLIKLIKKWSSSNKVREQKK